MTITQKLLVWYDEHHRSLPWRETRDPYKIWLSEIILQQTRVAQGLTYYHKFVSSFADVHALAHASEQQVLKLWQGLGYYSRARNLHHTAQVISRELNGQFPATSGELLKLKGIGEYTAAAIASVCYNEPIAVLDGNVARVLSRFTALKYAINASEGKKELQKLADQLLDRSKPGIFNQALMELGALVCVPRNPACNTCPLQYSCVSKASSSVLKYPVTKPKTQALNKYIVYLIIKNVNNTNEQVIIRQRINNDIWKNMYDFPSVETDNELTDIQLIDSILNHPLVINQKPEIRKISASVKHQLTHRTIIARFAEITLGQMPEISAPYYVADKLKLNTLPLPRLIDRYLNGK